MTDATDDRGVGEEARAVTEALEGLVGDFAAFKTRIEDRMTKQDE